MLDGWKTGSCQVPSCCVIKKERNRLSHNLSRQPFHFPPTTVKEEKVRAEVNTFLFPSLFSIIRLNLQNLLLIRSFNRIRSLFKSNDTRSVKTSYCRGCEHWATREWTLSQSVGLEREGARYQESIWCRWIVLDGPCDQSSLLVPRVPNLHRGDFTDFVAFTGTQIKRISKREK